MSDRVLIRPLEADERTHLIDVNLFGEPRFGSVYLIDEEERALVETGTSHTVGEVLRALRAEGVEPATVRHVVVTHIHLDHAGGAGFLLDHLPHARVYVHERGLPHLAHPQRLLESAARALGPAFESYGTLKPIPETRMEPLQGGEVLDLGGRELEFHYTPGHALHHLCIQDRSTGSVFTGDAAGIHFPDDGRLIPTTPFPEFDLPQAVGAMRTLEALDPRTLLYTHFGPRPDARRALEEGIAEYERWGAQARALLGERPLEEAVAALYEEWYADVEGFPRPFVERIIATNLRGFQRYFERTQEHVARGG